MSTPPNSVYGDPDSHHGLACYRLTGTDPHGQELARCRLSNK